ncbi:MAG TPA: hypothetical protein VE398_00240 [Acidobacteriota bacterium]|nr:hypothetical protein [Acidobacteriota bacterium]
MTSRIRFSSVLGLEYRDDLEELMFFNPQQRKALTGINHSISEYGVPNVVESNQRLRISVEGLPESQTLFAMDYTKEKPVLAGVMVYMRTDPENLVLLHIAVREDYSRSGIYGDEMLVLRFMTQLRDIAKRIKGIRAITLKYSSGLVIPV